MQDANIPSSVYYALGVLVVTNIGTLVSIATVAFRALWWASKLDSRVEDAKSTSVRAHRRIDIIESKK